MFQTLKNAWKTAELKSKLLFTLLIVVLYRLGSAIPVPWVTGEIGDAFTSSFNYAIQLLAGDAFSKATLFALSVSPYITSSIIVQLLTIAIPALERWAKDGENGKKKINFLTRCLTMGLAIVTAIGYANLIEVYGFVAYGNTNKVFAKIVIIACYVAGAAMVMWLAEKINEHGIGNGISIILFANIIARLPATFTNFYTMIASAAQSGSTSGVIVGIVWSLLIVALMIGLVWLIIWFTESERRIPVQYAKRVVGRKMYGGQSSNIPLKLNMTGVMPIIFASSIVSLLPTILALCGVAESDKGFWGWCARFFSASGVVYPLLLLVLIIAFAYFYTTITFDPMDVANNLKKNGGAIPGIRQGRPTADYIRKILGKVTLVGALFLSVIAVLPVVAGPHVIQHLINWIMEGSDLAREIAKYAADSSTNAYVTYLQSQINSTVSALTSQFTFGGTSLIIVVGVAIETFRELEAQLTMRNYKGFL